MRDNHVCTHSTREKGVHLFVFHKQKRKHMRAKCPANRIRDPHTQRCKLCLSFRAEELVTIAKFLGISMHETLGVKKVKVCEKIFKALEEQDRLEEERKKQRIERRRFRNPLTLALMLPEQKKIKNFSQLAQEWGYRTGRDGQHTRSEQKTHLTQSGIALQKWTDPDAYSTTTPDSRWGGGHCRQGKTRH